MTVSFSSGSIAVNPTAQPQTTASQDKENRGILDSTREAWKTTLKAKETTVAYGSGFFRGLKNAIYAGSALVGLDWFGKSLLNIKDGKNTVGHMLATPFVLAGKAVGRTTKYMYELACKKDGPTIAQAMKALVWDVPKKVLTKVYKSKNVSRIAKIGLPVIALAVAGYTTFRSYLNANERKARIDHRYGGDVGHQHKV